MKSGPKDAASKLNPMSVIELSEATVTRRLVASQTIELALQRVPPKEIAKRLGIEPSLVGSHLAGARRRGVDIPSFGHGGKKILTEEERATKAEERALSEPTKAKPLNPDDAAVNAALKAFENLPKVSLRIDELVHVEGIPREQLGRQTRLTLTQIEEHLAVVSAARTNLLSARAAAGHQMTSDGHEKKADAAATRAKIVRMVTGGMPVDDVVRATGIKLEQVRKHTKAGIRPPARPQKPELARAIELALDGYTPHEISKKLHMELKQIYNALQVARGRGVVIPIATKKKVSDVERYAPISHVRVLELAAIMPTADVAKELGVSRQWAHRVIAKARKAGSAVPLYQKPKRVSANALIKRAALIISPDEPLSRKECIRRLAAAEIARHAAAVSA